MSLRMSGSPKPLQWKEWHLPCILEPPPECRGNGCLGKQYIGAQFIRREIELHMVMLIGIVTMSSLVWVLTVCLARESDAERRRTSTPSAKDFSPSLTVIRENLKLAA